MHKNRNTTFPVVPEGSFLTVLRIGEKSGYFLCRCVCGKEWEVRQDAIRSGNTKSCECKKAGFVSKAQKIHGASHTSIHNVWWEMIDRCNPDKENPREDYALAGVTVCDRWKEPNGQGFLNFIADMGPRPTPKHQVDRYPDREGNYEPTNTRWATPAQQARNRKSNVNITWNGLTQCLADWARHLNTYPKKLKDRIAVFGLERAMAMYEEDRKKKERHANRTDAS